MKARKLKALLNNTDYTVAFYGNYIGIGSPLCHDLISLEISTNKITYALDTFRKGRAAIGSKELVFIWDKLHELVASGEINDIINGNDIIENALPVYTVRKGTLICTTTDAYGWPNVTVEGYMMHDNTYFETIREAIHYGIKEHECRINNLTERVTELRDEANKLEFLIQDSKNIINGLKLLTPAKGAVNYNMNTNFDPGTKAAEANEQATEQESAGAAAESAAQDQATGANESAEEGGVEG